MAALAGCGGSSHRGPANTTQLPTGTAPDGNPLPVQTDLRLPATGTAGIAAAAAPRGGPVSCAARGAPYVEGIHARRRVVALTFDDGPSGFTPQILKILERKHVHATFFVIGQLVPGHPDLLRRELRAGDIVGDHTWTHADMTLLPAAVQARQIRLTADAIHQATGFRTCIWRAPYGAIDGRMETLARGLGLNSVQWDTDPQDFTMPPVRTIIHRVVFGNPSNPDRGVHPGAIVLMHDGGGDRSHTVGALPTLIDQLRGRGYQFVTIPQLLGLTVNRRR